MAEDVSAKAGPLNGDGAAGIPFYEKQRQHLKELIAKKRALDKRITQHEDVIYQKETEYLDSTPIGNIITGFDSYIKGTGNAASQRRKMGLTDANRVFSRSSVSYNSNADTMTPGSTNSASGAPTPVSGSFGGANKDGGSGGAGTPSSVASKGATKKSKKSAAAVEDSETDARETNKKARTNFGAVRR